MATITTTTDLGVRRRQSAADFVATRLFDVVRYTVMVLLALIIVTPIIYGVLGGFKENGELVGTATFLPKSWLLKNYQEVLKFPESPFWTLLRNSTIVAAITVLLCVGAASLAAFVFARMDFRGREAVYTLFTLGLLFPIAVAILPLFLMINDLGLQGTYIGLALPQAAFLMPMTIIILRPFFKSIPNELEDAAKIDGCGTFGFFWRVLAPLSRPAIATVAVYATVMSWNSFFLPLIVTSDKDTWTLPLGIMNFQMQYSSDTALITAFLTITMIPALVFYMIAERQIVTGLTAGGVKG